MVLAAREQAAKKEPAAKLQTMEKAQAEGFQAAKRVRLDVTTQAAW
jgi:hypothetical protein